MRLSPCLALLGLPVLSMFACGDDAKPARDTVDAADTTPDVAADTTPDVAPDTAADAAAPDTVDILDTSAPDTADSADTADVVPSTNIASVLAAACPVVPSTLRVSTPAGNALAKLTLDAPGALCNDGSPGIAYVRAATDAARSKRWVFHLQGGAGCSSGEDCRDRWCGEQSIYDAAKMSSRWAKPTIGDPGLFRREVGNPPGQWNQVFVYYCTSDLWVGQAEIELTGPEGPYTLHARGHQILAGLLDALDEGARSDDGSVTLPRLGDAEVILWTGASAGAVGATHHLDWVADRYPSARVAGVFDAGYGPPADAFSEAVQAGAAAHAEANYLGFYAPANAFWDTSCLAANEAEPYRCSGAREVKLEHVTTPFFQRLDLRDPTGSQGFIGLGATLPEWSRASRDAMIALWEVRKTAAEGAAMTRTPGVFAPNCAQHIGTMSDDWYAGATVEADGVKYTYRDVLLAWLEGTDVLLVDTVPGTLSTCRATTDDR